eukprot:424715-Rhodomonas_salina.1
MICLTSTSRRPHSRSDLCVVSSFNTTRFLSQARPRLHGVPKDIRVQRHMAGSDQQFFCHGSERPVCPGTAVFRVSTWMYV